MIILNIIMLAALACLATGFLVKLTRSYRHMVYSKGTLVLYCTYLVLYIIFAIIFWTTLFSKIAPFIQ